MPSGRTEFRRIAYNAMVYTDGKPLSGHLKTGPRGWPGTVMVNHDFPPFTESDVEDADRGCLDSAERSIARSPDIASNPFGVERANE